MAAVSLAICKAGKFVEMMDQINTTLPRAGWTTHPFCCWGPWNGLKHVSFNCVEGSFDSGTGLGWIRGDLKGEGSPECGEANSLAIDKLLVEGDFFRDA